MKKISLILTVLLLASTSCSTVKNIKRSSFHRQQVRQQKSQNCVGSKGKKLFQFSFFKKKHKTVRNAKKHERRNKEYVELNMF